MMWKNRFCHLGLRGRKTGLPHVLRMSVIALLSVFIVPSASAQTNDNHLLLSVGHSMRKVLMLLLPMSIARNTTMLGSILLWGMCNIRIIQMLVMSRSRVSGTIISHGILALSISLVFRAGATIMLTCALEPVVAQTFTILWGAFMLAMSIPMPCEAAGNFSFK